MLCLQLSFSSIEHFVLAIPSEMLNWGFTEFLMLKQVICIVASVLWGVSSPGQVDCDCWYQVHKAEELQHHLTLSKPINTSPCLFMHSYKLSNYKPENNYWTQRWNVSTREAAAQKARQQHSPAPTPAAPVWHSRDLQCHPKWHLAPPPPSPAEHLGCSYSLHTT